MRMVIAILAACAVVMPGCSSIVSKSHYPVTIASSPDGAAFVVTNRAEQEVHRGNTPATITLNSGAGYFKGETYTVVFRKDGYASRVYTIHSTLDNWYFGNILLGGVLGMLIVDPATGAMYSLPGKVDVTLEQVASDARSPTLTISSIDELTPAQLSRLVSLE